jgi:FKBP-type peptidyl-prolyl cis-trans isomerase
MKRLLSVVCMMAIAVTASAQNEPGGDQKPSLHPRVKLETTLGNIVLELDGEKAPISTTNFMRYVEEGFYAGTIFHRVISTFMIQGGGFTPDMEEKRQGLHPPIKNEWENGLKNVRGSIAMARTSAPNSATAQFYINVVDNDALDQPRGGAAYAVFGKVVEGMDVVDKIKDTKVISHPKYPSPQAVTPDPAVVIKNATVVVPFDKTAAEAEMKKEQEEAEKAAAEAKSKREQEIVGIVKKAEEETKAKATKTNSGLYYIVLKEGTGASPKPTDTVRAHYRGTLTNGKEFDSSYNRGPMTTPLNSLIPGWVEGMGLMKAGGKNRLIIPPELAYGDRQVGNAIPPNSILIFDIELLEVNPQN